MNQIVLVGRVQDLKQEQEKTIMTLEVKRYYKNINGEYESDILPIYLYSGIAQTVIEYIKNGEVVGIKGRVQRINGNDFTANGYAIVGLVAEKVTFLSTRKEEE